MGEVGEAILRPFDEAIGEVTGRNLQREQIGRQRAALTEAEEEAERAAREEELRGFEQQRRASELAAGAAAPRQRRTAAAGATAKRQAAPQVTTLGADERTFLGL